MSVADYTTKIKEICESLTFVNVYVEEDEMLSLCLSLTISISVFSVYTELSCSYTLYSVFT
jgi:hypothetical protein